MTYDIPPQRLLLASGADLKSVARILGHASTVMTADLYGHVVDARSLPLRAL